MNKPKCNEYLYVQFLLSAQNNFSCSELGRVSPKSMAHDAPTRSLKREKLTPRILWKNARAHVDARTGYLVADDTVIDKPRSQDIQLVKWQYSGTHHDVVKGIGLETLLWTKDGDEHIPVDYRVYHPQSDGKTKNEHFREMIRLAHYRNFTPAYVLIDTWYTSLDNLKYLDSFSWKWIAPLQKNRIISTAPKQYCRIEELDIPEQGLVVHLKAYGFVKVFKEVSKTGDVEYRGTNDLNLSKLDVKSIYAKRWKIEEYHRGLKQETGIAKCQSRLQRSQRNHIWCSIHAFLILELHRMKTNISWQEAKLSIAREAIRQYLLNPRYQFNLSTA